MPTFCRYCGTPTEWVDLLIGRRRADGTYESVKRMVAPDPEGEIVRFPNSGVYRALGGRANKRAATGNLEPSHRYRSHSKTACSSG